MQSPGNPDPHPRQPPSPGVVMARIPYATMGFHRLFAHRQAMVGVRPENTDGMGPRVKRHGAGTVTGACVAVAVPERGAVIAPLRRDGEPGLGGMNRRGCRRTADDDHPPDIAGTGSGTRPPEQTGDRRDHDQESRCIVHLGRLSCPSVIHIAHRSGSPDRFGHGLNTVVPNGYSRSMPLEH